MISKTFSWVFSVVKLIVVVTVLSLITECRARTSKELQVTLPNGSQLVGRHLTSVSGKGILSFLGIPFAEPPIDELRFKSPQPAKPWKDVKMAIHNPPMCIQRDPFRRDDEIVGVEDCLYLNVYKPEKPSISGPLPVMIFFHGGGWMCGSGIKPFYGPDFLLEHDIIYIGANFRLGPLGFLSTEQEDCPGNFGLKDQVLALKWLKENIEAFGGNPYLVTIFGESAGGASVTYHMMSPLSKGLFHRGISQSGTLLDSWAAVAHEGVAKERSIKLGEMMGCKFQSKFKNMIECLRKVSAKKITEAFYDFYEWDTDPLIPFPPVIEPNSKDAFITEQPRFKTDPHGLDIPWMTGITSEEGALKTASLINLKELTNDINTKWDQALPISLYYNHLKEKDQKEITKSINEFYFKNRKLEEATQNNLTNLYTDAWFFAGMNDYLRTRLEHRGKRDNTFVYLFTHKGAASFTEVFQGGETFYGTSHAEELQYLFPIRQDLPYFFNSVPTDQDKKLTKLITKMWVNFAYHGNPTPESSKLLPWKTAKQFPLDYMRIGNLNGEVDAGKGLMSMERDLYPERTEFWRKMVKKTYYPSTHSNKDEL